jgi:rubredoxin
VQARSVRAFDFFRVIALPSAWAAGLPPQHLSRFNRASFRNGDPQAMKAYMCVICGYVYEEEKGDPVAGIAPGTRWEDVPLSWRCPDCGAGKEDFEMVEV